MPDTRVRSLFRRTRILAPPTDARTDADLLTRFLDQHDETAFESLVRRHGPMVLAACRSALRNPADADDAFQATFLVLVRRAHAIRDRAALGGWLYRVAYRASRKLRGTAGFVPLPDEVPARREDSTEVRRILDEEIARLPEKYRVVVELCYVVGRTTDDAATRLGWAKGTVLTRLAWARKRLRARLTQRGVTLAVGSLATALGRAHSVGSELVFATVRAAVAVAAGDVMVGVVSARTISLTEGVVRTMAMNKLKWVAAALLLVVALTGVGVGRWTADVTAEPGDKKKKAAKVEAEEPQLPPRARADDPQPPPRVEALQYKREQADDPPPADKKQREFVVTRPSGTWVREIPLDGGTIQITLHFQDDRLVCIVDQVAGEGSLTYTIEADYAINKESTVYGVITSLDLELPRHGKARGGQDTFKELLAIETMVVGQPFAFQYRQDASFTVKHFRGFGVGMNQDSSKEGAEVAAVFSGRYTNANAQNRQRIAPQPVRPAPRLRDRAPAPSNSDSSLVPGAVVPGGPAGYPGVPVSPVQPGAPALPPSASCLPDPTEDYRNIGEFWRRFWFKDTPSHLTPERIHGGIM